MPEITCTPEALAAAAEDYVGMEWAVRKAIRILLWCNFINGVPMVCNPRELVNAARCFYTCLSVPQLDAIETYLVCQIASGGGGIPGSTQVFSGNYGGIAPEITPTTPAAVAYDLDSPFNFWTWNGTAWGN